MLLLLIVLLLYTILMKMMTLKRLLMRILILGWLLRMKRSVVLMAGLALLLLRLLKVAVLRLVPGTMIPVVLIILVLELRARTGWLVRSLLLLALAAIKGNLLLLLLQGTMKPELVLDLRGRVWVGTCSRTEALGCGLGLTSAADSDGQALHIHVPPAPRLASSTPAAGRSTGDTVVVRIISTAPDISAKLLVDQNGLTGHRGGAVGHAIEVDGRDGVSPGQGVRVQVEHGLQPNVGVALPWDVALARSQRLGHAVLILSTHLAAWPICQSAHPFGNPLCKSDQATPLPVHSTVG